MARLFNPIRCSASYRQHLEEIGQEDSAEWVKSLSRYSSCGLPNGHDGKHCWADGNRPCVSCGGRGDACTDCYGTGYDEI